MDSVFLILKITRFRKFTADTGLPIPTHCYVPGCAKKGYSDEDGNKVSYFIFPFEKGLRKKWIHAIRRDEGKDFQIKPTTKV